MYPVVYFADKALIFTDKVPAGDTLVLDAATDGALSRAKICKILENHNSVAVISSDPEAAFERFASDFTRVEAAGGAVVDDRGRTLMIHRNGRWDLPKGHVEPGESAEQAAEREIEEETGVAARIVRPLCSTMHAYWFPPTGRWELKRTHWFLLSPLRAAALTPQKEEGIDRAVWCTKKEVAGNLAATFPTIRRVFESV